MHLVAFKTLPAGLAPGGTYCGATISSVNPSIKVIGTRTYDAPNFTLCAGADTSVAFVEEDYWSTTFEPQPSDETYSGSQAPPAYVPDDAFYYRQYAPEQIRANFAWRTTLGTQSASVCIIDGGVRKSHDDLKDNWINGYDFYNGDGNPEDEKGHGTYMAGIAAAGIDNHVGIAGMGNVRLYGVKAYGVLSSYTQEIVEQAITWCADNALPPVVISMSFGDYNAPDPNKDAVRLAVQYAYNVKHALLVAAGGQHRAGEPDNRVPYPAAYDEVIAVTATGPGSVWQPYSNHHSKVELVAPGSGVFSTNYTSDDGYGPYASGGCEHPACVPPGGLVGTSQSTAMVSGGAALYWDYNPTMSNIDLRQRLRDTAHPLLTQEYTGYGEIDMKCLFDGRSWPCVTI